mgnify:CR=1 FL=1
MFTELTEKEMYETDGGIGLLAVLGIVAAVIFCAGALKGCTDEAAK